MKGVKKVILLVNLGSPATLSVRAIRQFLRQFLADRRVVGLPRLIWFPILYAIILPFRAKKLLHKYKQIWHSSGLSPLIYYTQLQASNLQRDLPDSTIVDYAFCYGKRSIIERLKELNQHESIQELTVIPLYPQYSSSTSAVVFDQVASFYAKQYYLPTLKFIRGFADNHLYINALANLVKAYWRDTSRGEYLMVSFHSLPCRLIEEGDSYLDECQLTYHLLCQQLGLDQVTQAKLVYQSKFGRDKWLTPATSNTLIELAQKGSKVIDVICPGFISDCLETLEEIEIQNQELFIAHGGEKLNYIRCLNDSLEVNLIMKQLVL